MPRNRVQHQKGLSDDAFERLYPDEEACRKAWFTWRWPEGFKCPRCAVAAKHLPRYLGAFAWRFNRRFVLKTIYERLAIAAAAPPPMPSRLKLAEARWYAG